MRRERGNPDFIHPCSHESPSPTEQQLPLSWGWRGSSCGVMPQAGVSISPALLSFSPFFFFFFFFFPFNPWKQSQRAAAPGSASCCGQGRRSAHTDLGFAGDSRKIPLAKRTLWLPGGFRAGQGVGRSRDVLGVQERSPPCLAKGRLFLGCKRKIVQLLKLAVNPRTIINNFPAKVPGYFLSVLAWRGRFILFAAWNFFPLSFFPSSFGGI